MSEQNELPSQEHINEYQSKVDALCQKVNQEILELEKESKMKIFCQVFGWTKIPEKYADTPKIKLMLCYP